MKRLLTGIVTAALVLSMGTVGASAAYCTRDGFCGGRGQGHRAAACAYMDADNDGVCDHYGSGGCGSGSYGRGHGGRHGGRRCHR